MGLKEYYQLLDQGRVHEAFQEIASLQGDQRSEAEIAKAIFIVGFGDLEQAIHIIDRIVVESQDNPYLHVLARIGKFWAMIWQAKYKESWREYQLIDELLTTLAASGRDVHQNFLNLRFLQGTATWMKAVYHIGKGDNDKAQKLYFQALDVVDEEGFPLKSIKVEIYNDLGVLAERRGDWVLATDYYEKIIILCDELNNQMFKSHAFLLLGRMYLRQGDLNQASEHLHKGLDLAERTQITLWVARGKKILGNLYHTRGEFQKAKQYYIESINLTQQMQLASFSDLSVLYYQLCLLYLHLKDLDQAKIYLKHLQTQSYNDEEPISKMYCNLAEAQILKTSQRFKDKAKAQDLFREIFKDEITLQHSKFIAMLHLCDLLLQEFSMLGDVELFNEAQAIAIQVGEFAETWQFLPDIIRTQLLQAKFALIKGDAHYASQLLTQAYELAEKKGLNRILDQVKAEQILLEKQLLQWKQLTDRNAPLQERVAFAEVETYLQEAIKLRDLTPSLN